MLRCIYVNGVSVSQPLPNLVYTVRQFNLAEKLFFSLSVTLSLSLCLSAKEVLLKQSKVAVPEKRQFTFFYKPLSVVLLSISLTPIKKPSRAWLLLKWSFVAVAVVLQKIWLLLLLLLLEMMIMLLLPFCCCFFVECVCCCCCCFAKERRLLFLMLLLLLRLLYLLMLLLFFCKREESRIFLLLFL